jgi:hypothetical protein
VFGPVIAPPALPPGLVATAAGWVGAGTIVPVAVGIAVLVTTAVTEAFGVAVRTIVTGVAVGTEVEVGVGVEVEVEVEVGVKVTERPACAGWVPPTAAATNSATPPTAATTPAPMILFKASLLLDVSFLRPDDTRPDRDRQANDRLIISTMVGGTRRGRRSEPLFMTVRTQDEAAGHVKS